MYGYFSMTTLRTPLVLIAILTSFYGSAGAQGGRLSPHETVSATIDGAKISVTYGRPYMRGRMIMGGLVPYGAVWRTGADEATTLVTDKALRVGSTQVPAGTYTLYTLPDEKAWTLIINRQTGQDGTEYTPARDLARIEMQVGSTRMPVEQLTLTLNDTQAGGELTLQWERTEARVVFSVAN